MIAGIALAGCAGNGSNLQRPTERVDRGPAPLYADIAARYNERVERLNSIFAPAVVRFTYRDEHGEQKTDQGEGILQVVRPDHLALSIGKAGKRLFWFGCDDERYWWFDLVEKRIASVGHHDQFDPARSGIGLAIRPLDVVLLLGIMPLPAPDADDPESGATQWSNDGRWVGVTTRTDSDGYQRLWIDPATLEPQKIELFDGDRQLEIVADLGDFQYVRIAGFGGVGPRVPGKLVALHQPSQTLIRLDLSGIEDGTPKIDPKAFDFDTLSKAFQVEKVIDLDQRRPAVGAAMGGIDPPL